jgi:hypothetical protein
MTDRTDGYAIFVNGVLHYVSEADSRDEAYSEYAEKHGFDRSTYPMTQDKIGFHYIPPTDMEDWDDATANDYPVVNHSV